MHLGRKEPRSGVSIAQVRQEREEFGIAVCTAEVGQELVALGRGDSSCG
jgi:hypothetical protein